MDERREHVRQKILAHFDKAHFEGSMMYGVHWSDMDRDELSAVLCYVSKNPDIIKAMVPDKRPAKKDIMRPAMAHRYECDCGAVFNTHDGLMACQNSNHGVPPPMDQIEDKLLTLQMAVVGDIPEQPPLWRINWLKSLIDAIDQGELAITDKCDDPDAMWDCINECRKMVRDVNDVLSGRADDCRV